MRKECRYLLVYLQGEGRCGWGRRGFLRRRNENTAFGERGGRRCGGLAAIRCHCHSRFESRTRRACQPPTNYNLSPNKTSRRRKSTVLLLVLDGYFDRHSVVQFDNRNLKVIDKGHWLFDRVYKKILKVLLIVICGVTIINFDLIVIKRWH